jgi:ferritin-like protein
MMCIRRYWSTRASTRVPLNGLGHEQEKLMAHNTQKGKIMAHTGQPSKHTTSRRSFLRKGLVVGGAGTIGAALMAGGLPALVEASGGLTPGDAAILRFLSAAEILETDFWQQYNELGGIQDSEVPGGSGSKPYTAALQNLDSDMPQYIHDNTEDEFTHFTFINAYLVSKGGEPVNLDQFRTLPSSKATGAQQIGRLTNLMQLTVDTSFWTRYRSRAKNPDFGDTFPPAVPGLLNGQFPAIPRSDADLAPKNHIQAIANTAAFHFASIEQGGSSLYPSLAQRVTDVEVLRVLLSIGPTETMHFQTWQDKAGAAVSQPLAPLTDPTNRLTFPDLNAPPFDGEDFSTSLIMPEPTIFLSRTFPVVSIIRPTETEGAATGAAHFLTNSGLFLGQPKAFFDVLFGLAAAADSAHR